MTSLPVRSQASSRNKGPWGLCLSSRGIRAVCPTARAFEELLKEHALGVQVHARLWLVPLPLPRRARSMSPYCGPDPALSLGVQGWKDGSPLEEILSLFASFHFHPLVPNSILPNPDITYT